MTFRSFFQPILLYDPIKLPDERSGHSWLSETKKLAVILLSSQREIPI